jgi:diguanylate cyclase (GGDEF)-like protein
MTDAATELSSPARPPFSLKKTLAGALWGVVGIHLALLIAIHNQPVAASRTLTASIAILATACIYWRALAVPSRERSTLRWAGAGMFLWGIAHLVETLLGPTAAASNLAVDASDFIYLVAAFPLLLALSTTRETASIRSVFLLNIAQIGLALILVYVRLYRMDLPAAAAATVMGKIYGVACVLLVLLSALRLLTWETAEERRSIGLVFVFFCAYMPVELGMDFATARWNLHAGTLFDLCWSVPFLLTGLEALYLPVDADRQSAHHRPKRSRLLVETLCPMLITTGVFALAASVTSQHVLLALASIFLLLLIQGLHAGVLQLNYVTGRMLLLEREQELRSANETLQQLSLLDPLTRVANRRRFDAALDGAWRRAVRRRQLIALLLIDVDYFKGINDKHGHAYGDECLVAVSRVAAKQAGRPDDLLARYGGDEFFLLLPDTDNQGAMVVADRIHAAIAEQAAVNQTSPLGGRLTVSIGAAVIDARSGKEPSALVETADKALYEAKRKGRNRTHLEAV